VDEEREADNKTEASRARPHKIAELVARQIVNDIVERGLEPGTRLAPEAVMLRRYDIGRASLREALRILEVHGLIRIKPGPHGGPVVVQVDSRAYARTNSFYFQLSRATLGQLLEAKIAVEPVLARLAAERLTPETAAALEAVVDAERVELETRPDVWGLATLDFHAVVARMSGNPVLDVFGLAIIEIQAERLRRRTPIGHRRQTWETHRRIADAILSGDASLAEKLTRRHAEDQLVRFGNAVPGALDELIEWH
jgi:GntR family transcriptional regulator, transcriptional repressor for pyruvate dehydrogenase complex